MTHTRYATPDIDGLTRVSQHMAGLIAKPMTDDVVDELAMLTMYVRHIRDNTVDSSVRACAHELIKTMLDGAPSELRQSMGVLE